MFRADEALLKGDRGTAQSLWSQAAELEVAALSRVPGDRSRTRGTLAVSAVSLFRRADRLEEAQSLAHRLLSEPPIADWVTSQLDALLDEMRSEQRARQLGFEVTPHVFEWSLRGPAILVGEGPMGLVLQKIDQVMKYGTRIGEYLAGYGLRKMGPPPKAVRELMSMTLSEPIPGSFRFRVRLLRQAVQTEIFPAEERPAPDAIASTYLNVLKAASLPESAQLDEIVPQEDYREAFLQLVRSLAPDGKQVMWVEVGEAGATERPTQLSRHTAVSIRERLMASRPAEEQEVYEDILRALDLNHGWISLGEPEKIKLYVDKESPVLEDVVGPLVNRRVRVSAYRKRSRPVIRDIEATEGDEAS